MGRQMKCRKCKTEFNDSRAGTKNGQLACPHCGSTNITEA